MRELTGVLLPEHPELKVYLDPRPLAELPEGTTLLLVPSAEHAAWLNLNRPVFAARALRVVVCCDAETSRVLARRAPDFFDWVSHWVECPVADSTASGAAPAPGSVEARGQAQLWSQDGRFAEAEALLRRNLEIHTATSPIDALEEGHIHAALARTLIAQGRTGEASSFAERAPRAATERVDVLIITVVKAEYEAVLGVDTGAPAGSAWQERPGPAGHPVALRSFATHDGGVLRIAVTHALEMGGVAAANAALPLLTGYTPRCLAMCGVCAGRRGEVNLGDVIIADRLWSYDSGAIVVEDDDQGRPVQRFKTDQLAYALDPGWKQRAESFRPDSAEAWLASRPRSPEDERDGEPDAFKVHVGAIATTAKVVRDDRIFDKLPVSMRRVLGLEMEAAGIVAVTQIHRLNRLIVMKGVADFADSSKDDRFKAFAARASAECLIAFLRSNLPAEQESRDSGSELAG